MVSMQSFKLNNGVEIPALGLGTFGNDKKNINNVLKSASQIGYTLIDTSPAYHNEKDIAKALWCGNIFCNNVNRKKYFLETKLFLNHCYERTEYIGLKETLKRLQTDYIDSYLLHWALPDKFIKNYKEMEKFYKDGLVKSIGVCNMEIHHLEKLLNECEIVPAINQVELHPLLTQKPLEDFCRKNGILIMSYTPFGRMNEKLFSNEILVKIANKYNKKMTQIILKWNIENGRCVIPKSSNPLRLKENFDIFDFDIEKEDLDLIDSINEDYRFRFHPDIYPLDWEKNYVNNR